MAVDRGAGFQDKDRDPNWSADGYGNQLSNGSYVGDNAYDTSVANDRQQANTSNAPSVQLDQGQANQSRGLQMGALGMLRTQATGAAPSAAAILSQRANEQAGAAMARSGVAGHGMGARIAGMGAAAPQVMSQANAANAANAASRAQEVSAGQNAYATGAGQVNTQDIGAATAQANLDAAQRAQNQQREEYYDQLGYDTRRVQANNAQTYNTQEEAKTLADQQYRDAKENQTVGQVMAAGNGLLTGGSGMMSAMQQAGQPQPTPPDQTSSDPRTKMNIGSLSGLRRGGR